MVASALPGFAQRLNALFDASRDSMTGKPYTNVAVAHGLSTYGVTISGSYLGKLRNEQKGEPGASLVWALTQFFGAPADYFFGAVLTLDGRELGRRLKILEDRTGVPFDLAHLVAAVNAAGEPFGESSWDALRGSVDSVRARRSVLDAIADYFDVPRDYLVKLDDWEQADLTEAQMDLVDAMRETGSSGVSMRSVGQPTSGALRAIAAALRSSHAAATRQ